MAAGERTGLGQSPVAAAGPGKELSTNWLRPASGNLATGLASEAPSFRSSWQSQVNAWRGVPRGTNGVESQDAGEAGTADTMSGALMSHAANPGQTLLSARMASPSPQSNGAVTKQKVSVPDVAGQKQTWTDPGRSVGNAMQNAGTQITSTGNTYSTATERPGTANRSRAGSAAPPANRENTAQTATVGAQPIAPTIEAPILLPAAPARSQIPTLAQTAETTSASGPNFAPSNWRTTQFSGSAQLSGSGQFSGPGQLSGPAQLSGAEEIASAATGSLAPGALGSGAAAGGRTRRTTHTGPEFIPRNATESEAMHETAASSLDDAEAPATSQPMTSLFFRKHAPQNQGTNRRSLRPP